MPVLNSNLKGMQNLSDIKRDSCKSNTYIYEDRAKQDSQLMELIL